jgi:capsular polysaccharide biosynthesis protein
VLCVPAGEKYFHWMMDVLPRLELIERAGHILDSIDWFVCNPLLYDYQFESLDLLGIPKEKFISLDSRSHFEFTELLVPSLAGTSGNMLRSNIDFIRSLWTPSTHKADRKLFISRSDAKYRHLINEQEGYQKLRQHGYEYTTLTGTSVMDQSKLFSAASEIVACHGAGLTNLAFCQSGTRVLELFAPQYVNPCYYSLSHWRDIQYAYLIGEGDRGAPGTDLHKIEADITADANQILSLMGYT